MEGHTDRRLEEAWTKIQHGHYDGAIDTLREILSHDPDMAEAHAYLAICLLNKRRAHAATQEAQIALTLEPETELCIYALALTQIAQRKFHDAEANISRLLDLNPNNAHYYLLLADLYTMTAKNKDVLALLDKALALSPENPDTLSKLSDYYLAMNNQEQAEHYATEALRIDPEHADALISMGHLCLSKGDINTAREHAIWALRQEPDNSSALYLMTAIKARANPLLGLWWRYNAWINRVGIARSILILLSAFLVYRISSMIFMDMGRDDIANIINFCWLGIVIYSFIGPAIFEKSLKKELAKVKLGNDF